MVHTSFVHTSSMAAHERLDYPVELQHACSKNKAINQTAHHTIPLVQPSGIVIWRRTVLPSRMSPKTCRMEAPDGNSYSPALSLAPAPVSRVASVNTAAEEITPASFNDWPI